MAAGETPSEMEATVIRRGECVTIPAFTPFKHISGENSDAGAEIALSLVVQQHPQVCWSVGWWLGRWLTGWLAG